MIQTAETFEVPDDRFEKARAAIEARYRTEMENLKLGRLRDMSYTRDRVMQEKRISRKDIQYIIDEYKYKLIDAEEMFERLNGYFLNDDESHRTYDITAFEMIACALKDEIVSEFKHDAYDRKSATSITDIGIQRILTELIVRSDVAEKNRAKLMVKDFVANLRDAGRAAIGESRSVA